MISFFHPLSVFPDLFTYVLIAPTLLRVTIATVGLIAGYSRFTGKMQWTSIFYFITSFCILFGFYTQIAVLVGLFVNSFDYYMTKQDKELSTEKKILYVLVKVILISLLFTGPGLFAFDLPL
jgi:uncharacterized membrane protein YphA (DoxX/SURF4 family)